MGKFKDLTGLKIGRLTPLYWEKAKSHRRWICRCECGNISKVLICDFDKTKSCGCLRNEKTIARSTIHGKSNSPIYRTWANMKNRCLNKSRHDYKYYGARGISICKRWMSFNNFYTDMGDPPFKGATLGRINNNGNYGPSNCRWETMAEQMRNTSKVRLYKINGENLTICDIARKFKINYRTLLSRINILGWPIEQSYIRPVIK